MNRSTPWRRLDLRMLVVGPLTNLAQLLPVVALVLITGRSGDLGQVWYALGGAVFVVLAGVVRWRTTRYRITAERVELHTGLLRRQRRSVPRDRIRTVDLTASPVHRVFGLSVVRVGSATGAGSVGDRSAAWTSTPSARPRPNACAGSCSTARRPARGRPTTPRRRPSSPTCAGRGCASRR